MLVALLAFCTHHSLMHTPIVPSVWCHRLLYRMRANGRMTDCFCVLFTHAMVIVICHVLTLVYYDVMCAITLSMCSSLPPNRIRMRQLYSNFSFGTSQFVPISNSTQLIRRQHVYYHFESNDDRRRYRSRIHQWSGIGDWRSETKGQ